MGAFGLNTFDEIYILLCNDILDRSEKCGDTLELRNVDFFVGDITNMISTARNLSQEYALAELSWHMAGARDVSFIGQFGSIWKGITDDGCTNNSAYGYILQKQEGFNQINKIIDLLEREPNTRRAVLNINKANPYVIETKDEPCTIALQFLRRQGRLHCTAMMRSNDIYYGLPYDVIYFTTLQKIIADRLGLTYGDYSHYAVSLHAYAKDLDKIRQYAEKDPEIASWNINHRALQIYAKDLYNRATRETILELAKERGVIIYEN